MTEDISTLVPKIDRLSDFDDLSLSLNGTRKDVLFGFSAVLFYEGGHTLEGRLRGNRILEDYHRIFAEETNYFHPLNARSRRKLDRIDPIEYYDKQAEKVPEIATYGAGLYGFPAGMNTKDATPYFVSNVGVDKFSKWSFVTAYFPASWVDEAGYDTFRQTISRWCDILKPAHGTAGFSVLFDEGGAIQHQSRLAFPIFTRFPGMDVPDISSWVVEVHQEENRRIRTTNWLTILDTVFVEEIGGMSEIEKELGDDCRIHAWSSGLMIQAGAEPQVGDINRGDIPQAYRKVARVTKPVRFDAFEPDSTITVINPPPPLNSYEATRKWFNRFD